MNTEFISCFPVLLGVVTALIAFIMSIRLKKHDSASLIFFQCIIALPSSNSLPVTVVIGSLEKEFAILQEFCFSGFERLADVELLPLFKIMEKKNTMIQYLWSLKTICCHIPH